MFVIIMRMIMMVMRRIRLIVGGNASRVLYACSCYLQGRILLVIQCQEQQPFIQDNPGWAGTRTTFTHSHPAAAASRGILGSGPDPRHPSRCQTDLWGSRKSGDFEVLCIGEGVAGVRHSMTLAHPLFVVRCLTVYDADMCATNKETAVFLAFCSTIDIQVF